MTTGRDEALRPRRTPAQTFPVGSFVLEEMHARDWTIGQLATITGIDAGEICDLIAGIRPLTDVDALALALALGTSPDLWRDIAATHEAHGD
jgi:plasmid maintenance system antidote protein VapI